MEDIIAVLGFMLFLISIPMVFTYKAYIRHKEHLEMLNRGVNPAQFTSPPSTRSGNFTLLFGLLNAFFGLALIISAVLVQKHFDRDMITAGIIFIFIGIAFMTYWKVTTKDRNRMQRTQEEHYQWLKKQSEQPLVANKNISTHEDPHV